MVPDVRDFLVQSARMARLITSGDGTLLQCEPSTSGELPPHIGPPGRQNSLEFLPVLPPMHVHSHPVTTGHGQYVSLCPSHICCSFADGQYALPKATTATWICCNSWYWLHRHNCKRVVLEDCPNRQ